MIVLIPAYEPDEQLVHLVESVRERRPDQTIVVVDDGSGPAYAPIFDAVRAAGADVIGHPANRGKGVALKRGFAHAARRYPGHDVVSADCDGQHALDDIVRVADAVAARRGHATIVLGARQFVGDVPGRSRLGNTLTRAVFRASTGARLQDTQTGLRGYPASLLPWLQAVPGDRFEYELEVLLAANRDRVPLTEVPIATIYLDGNESSHFHPIRDSVRVYLPFVKFSLSSIAAFAVDASLFFALMALTGRLGLSVVAARLVSASVNFATNRRLVFAAGTRGRWAAATRYSVLVLAVMAANYALLHTLTGLGLALLPAKLVTEVTLFLAGYRVQQRFVFGAAPGDLALRSPEPLGPVTARPEIERVGSAS